MQGLEGRVDDHMPGALDELDLDQLVLGADLARRRGQRPGCPGHRQSGLEGELDGVVALLVGAVTERQHVAEPDLGERVQVGVSELPLSPTSTASGSPKGSRSSWAMGARVVASLVLPGKTRCMMGSPSWVTASPSTTWRRSSRWSRE